MLRFNANLFRLAFTCASNEETRYYLKGVYVEPHPQGGVTLTATDGHRMVVIRDVDGKADESAIICLGDALKQCKAKAGFTRVVAIGSGDSEATIYEAREPAIETDFRKIGIATDVRIDGPFPDYRRVVPTRFSDAAAPMFQGGLVASFGDMARELAAHKGWRPTKYQSNTDRQDTLRILCGDDGSKPEGAPALILFPSCDFAFGIIMPCSLPRDAEKSTPIWFRAAAKPVAQAAE